MNFDDRSEHEQKIIEGVAAWKGEDWAENHAEMILAQARLVGELKNE